MGDPQPQRTWLSRHRWLLSGILLLAGTAVLYPLPTWIYGEPSAFIHVRWSDSLQADARQRLEQELGLIHPAPKEGTTWGYFLTDVSAASVERVVRHPQVQDTHHIDRARFAIAADTERMFVGRAADWLPELLRSSARFAAVAAVLFVLLDAAGQGRRRRLATALGRPLLGAWRFALNVATVIVRQLPHVAGPRTTALFAVLAIVFAVVENDPAAWRWLIREDGPVEDATSAALAIAGIVFALAARRHAHMPGLRRFCIVFAGLLMVGALEEISWGQRIIGVSSPDFFREHNAQQEVNIHNTLQQYVPFTCPICTDGRLLTKHVVILGLAVYGIILPVLLHLRSLQPYLFARYLLYPPLFLSPAIVIAGMFMFDWFDVPFGNEEEVGELLLGIYLVMFAWHAERRRTCCPTAALAQQGDRMPAGPEPGFPASSRI